MNREIKFRGHTCGETGGKWVIGYFTTYDDVCYIKPISRDQRYGCGIPVFPESVGQFTGLKDKNGVEIYEGDLCRTRERGHLVEAGFHNFKQCFLVRADKAFLSRCHHLDFLNYLTEENEDGGWTGKSDHLEVIGDIYQNPELLK